MRRRQFLTWLNLGLFDLCRPTLAEERAQEMVHRPATQTGNRWVTLFLCGDVMTGRGIDQVLPYPAPPWIYEPYANSARDYVEIAERTSGPIPAPVGFGYVWGDALAELDRFAPDLRLINLETAVTRSEHPWRYKGIHYRMSPENVPCLQAAGIDGCVLANNHVLDWGYQGLKETLETLKAARLRTVGAGRTAKEAEAPAVFNGYGGQRILVLALAHASSGVPPDWRAGAARPGVAFIDTFSATVVDGIASRIAAARQPGDLVVFSIHWGGNWGYEVPIEQQRFARALIDRADVDLVHGHSSHHPKGIEIYRERPILYGCGDFLNDYEGISGHREYRSDLSLMYFVSLDPVDGGLRSLKMKPLQLRRFRLQAPSAKDRLWVARTLDRECRRFGSGIQESSDGLLELTWNAATRRLDKGAPTRTPSASLRQSKHTADG